MTIPAPHMDSAFRLAGFPQGRPTLENAVNIAPPGDGLALAGIYTDETMGHILLLAGPVNAPGYLYSLAAHILSPLISSGLASNGRSLDILSYTYGGITTNHSSYAEYAAELGQRQNYLFAQAANSSVDYEDYTAFAIQNPDEVARAIETLQGIYRLDYNSLKNKPGGD